MCVCVCVSECERGRERNRAYSTDLGKFERLTHNALLLIVIADLNIAGQGEVLAEWMTLEAVVGENTPQVGMA